MTALRRTRIGPFRAEDAIDPRGLTVAALREALIPPRQAVSDWPDYTASESEVAALELGLRIRPGTPFDPHCNVAAVDAQGKLIALTESLPTGELAPRTVFSARQ
jgi:tRNA U55 pseudouridine synthase TruB